MKQLVYLSLGFLFLCNPAKAFENADPIKSLRLNLESEIASVLEELSFDLSGHYDNLAYTKTKIDQCEDPLIYMELIKSERKIAEQIKEIELQADLELTRLRYQKGLELMRLIFEKILGLDHHFTSLRTFQNISDLTNPNTFPDFIESKGDLIDRVDKKKRVALPSVLEGNPFVSLTMSIVSTFMGDGKNSEKEADLEKVSCILDFTVKMHTDLNIIYYETEFLKEANTKLKTRAIELFKAYTDVVDYHTTLPDCRNNDDWDNLYEKLDETILSLQENLELESGYEKTKAIKSINNLEFSIDRLLNFLDTYTDFIVEGEQYYGKFTTILNNYGNEDICTDYLPHQFTDLRQDVELSILKFSEAYDVSELKGSKLRDLLYGVPQ